ncbi:23S rRNA (adenine(2503)-C(2))-methyltransferase RlmN [Chitinophagaceae bacterium MMS25-I14]
MKNLRNCTQDDLKQLMKEWGEPAFRAQQIFDWVWKKFAGDISDMSNLSKSLREKLAAHYYIPKVKVHHGQYSSDGTIKNRFQLHDGYFVEGVLIPTEKRMTACVSSQVGCSLSCKFCATGYLERRRNLDFDEIVDEVVLLNEQAQKHYGKNLSNIVFMGMGEPLLNYKSMMKAIERITSPESLGMSPRRITVSTAGVAKMIRQLGDDEVKFKLALSLHAPTDAQRNEIMPINESNNLKVLIEALNYFYQKTGNEITFEYILFKDFNDSLEDAENLVKICRQVPADLVNIIEYNPIDNAKFEKPDEETADRFMHYLESKRVNARLRRSRGKDIDAACGQLANVDHAGQVIAENETDQ